MNKISSHNIGLIITIVLFTFFENCGTSKKLHTSKGVNYSIKTFDGLKYMQILKDSGVVKYEYIIPLRKSNTDIDNYRVEKKESIAVGEKIKEVFFIGVSDSSSTTIKHHPEERTYIQYQPSEFKQIGDNEIEVFNNGKVFLKEDIAAYSRVFNIRFWMRVKS